MTKLLDESPQHFLDDMNSCIRANEKISFPRSSKIFFLVSMQNLTRIVNITLYTKQYPPSTHLLRETKCTSLNSHTT